MLETDINFKFKFDATSKHDEINRKRHDIDRQPNTALIAQ